MTDAAKEKEEKGVRDDGGGVGASGGHRETGARQQPVVESMLLYVVGVWVKDADKKKDNFSLPVSLLSLSLYYCRYTV